MPDSRRREQENSLYTIENDCIPRSELTKKNRNRSWAYGYNKDHDVVIISKTGRIGDIYNIEGLRIALPAVTDKPYKRSSVKEEQYWEHIPIPKEISSIKSLSAWKKKPKEFKNKWVSYIEQDFDRREYGLWFMNNGVPTWLPPDHYMYLQHSKIDVGLPDFREANRIFWIYWEACVADNRCYGLNYVKIRRSGFSFMGSSHLVNVGTLATDAMLGILSKTGPDAKSMFVNKVVPINSHYPFYFKPQMDGMEKPKTELSYRIPSRRITRNNMNDDSEESDDGLNTVINWRNTDDNSYDGEKMLRLIHDESGKWLPPNQIQNNWKVTKTCLRTGKKIVGKCMMGSTVNSQDKGGKGFKEIHYDSDPTKRNANGQTVSGLYWLFIPMEWNMEGFIDRYGMPVMRTPKKPIMGIDGEWIDQGAIDYWEAEVDSLKNNPDAQNEYYRQYPRKRDHAFRDESKNSIFNLSKIYSQIEHNDSGFTGHSLTKGSFSWRNGKPFTEVVWSPDKGGRFLTSWIPKLELQNNVISRNGRFYPGNEHIGAFGIDSYDISATVDGRGSKGAMSGLTMFNMDNAPSNEFFLEYRARPQTAEIFFEDMMMAMWFYGMPALVENNKPRLLYAMKKAGMRPFSINRPDKHYTKLSVTEKELGGIPNTSNDVKISHASAIEMYIEKYVGYDQEGNYRDPGEIGTMEFNNTLSDWAKFDINNRTKFDLSISSGLAIMACQKNAYKQENTDSKIRVTFARYDNSGIRSKIYE